MCSMWSMCLIKILCVFNKNYVFCRPAAPTCPPERIRPIYGVCRGILYVVSNGNRPRKRAARGLSVTCSAMCSVGRTVPCGMTSRSARAWVVATFTKLLKFSKRISGLAHAQNQTAWGIIKNYLYLKKPMCSLWSMCLIKKLCVSQKTYVSSVVYVFNKKLCVLWV